MIQERTEWRADQYVDDRWRVRAFRGRKMVRLVAINLDEPTAHLIAAAPAKERLCEELADALEGFLDHSTSSYCEFCDSHAPKDDAGDLTDVVRHKTDCPVVTANTLLTKAGRAPR